MRIRRLVMVGASVLALCAGLVGPARADSDKAKHPTACVHANIHSEVHEVCTGGS